MEIDTEVVSPFSLSFSLTDKGARRHQQTQQQLSSRRRRRSREPRRQLLQPSRGYQRCVAPRCREATFSAGWRARMGRGWRVGGCARNLSVVES